MFIECESGLFINSKYVRYFDVKDTIDEDGLTIYQIWAYGEDGPFLIRDEYKFEEHAKIEIRRIIGMINGT